MDTVVIADSRAGVSRLVKQTLEGDGIGVVQTRSGGELLGALRDLPLEAVVIGQVDGISTPEAIRSVRQRWDVPLIALAEHASSRERTAALVLGADDAMDEPFDPDELAARVRAIMRRRHPSQSGIRLRVGDAEVDLDGHLVMRDGEEVPLTRREWTLFRSLAENAGKVLTAEQLLTMAFGPAYRDDAQYLRVYISRLRSRLGSRAIRTYHGVGYMLVASPAPAPVAVA